jgi:hypothetical protein
MEDCNPVLYLCGDQYTYLVVTLGVEIVIYGVFLGFVVYMTYAFLIKMKFYREKHLIAFYALALMIIILRIA